MIELAVLFVGAVVVGIPIAVWVHRWDQVNPMRLTVLGAVFGVVSSSVVATILLRLGIYTPVAFAIVIGSVTALSWGLVIVRVGLPSFTISRSSWFFVLLVPLVVLLREHPVYFIYQIGDMGEYINRANDLNATGTLTESFPHLFTTALAAAGAVVGADDLVYLVPLVGGLFWGVATLLIDAIGGRPVAWVLSTVLALHLVPVWFSRFPVSESLYALVLVTMMCLLKNAIDSGDRRLAIAAGLMPGVLLLVRGNAVLLAPVLFLVAVMTALGASERAYGVVRNVYIASYMSLAIGYFYNVTWVHSYFYETQLRDLGGSLIGLLDSAGLDTVTLRGLLLTIGVGVSSIWILDRLHLSRLFRKARRQGSMLFVIVGPLCFAAVAFVITSPIGGGLIDGGGRFGLLILLLALVGIFLAGAWTTEDGPRIVIALSSMLVVVYGILHALRLTDPRGHAFFLYWDRYMFSEVFPSVVVLAAAGLSRLFGFVSLTTRRPLAIGGLALITIGTVLLGGGPASAMRERMMFADSYEELSTLNSLALTAGDLPVFFSGYESQPEGWIFPNSFRAIATPLADSFSRDVPNIKDLDDFGLDPSVTERELYEYLKNEDVEGVYVIRAVGPGAHKAEDGKLTNQSVLGKVEVPIEVLRQAPGVLNPETTQVDMTFEVVLVSLPL